MRTYTRVRIPGACYFFTVNLAQRRGNSLLIRKIADLREAFRRVRRKHPFRIEAIVILPDHRHSIWQLPAEDSDFPMRWRLIKARFSRAIATGERISASRVRKGERGIWQRRFWEHMIRNAEDYRRHVDYNPVKHGYVTAAREWPYSSFHAYVERGVYPADWGTPPDVSDMELE